MCSPDTERCSKNHCWPLVWFMLRPCQHLDGYIDGRPQITVHTNERTQVHSARSSLTVTHPSTNRGRHCLTFSERATELALVATVSLSRSAHISTTLAKLHWQRAAESITFNLATMTFRCLQGAAPGYRFADFIRVADVPSCRFIRSSSSFGHRDLLFRSSYHIISIIISYPDFRCYRRFNRNRSF